MKEKSTAGECVQPEPCPYCELHHVYDIDLDRGFFNVGFHKTGAVFLASSGEIALACGVVRLIIGEIHGDKTDCD
ncbi:hypothetical protein [Dickeya dadantii]|nr:hypothetical protein [Dickeya dadantii]NPE72372.1 hypothetical protein [Dickeya dadantii]